MKLFAFSLLVILWLCNLSHADETTNQMIAILKQWASEPKTESAEQYGIRLFKEREAAKAVEQHKQDAAYKLYLLTLQTDAQLRQAQAMEEANARREELEFLRLQRIIKSQNTKK